MSDSKSESDTSSSSSNSNTDTPLETLKYAFAIISNNPYCTGSVALDPTMSTLFYRSGEGAAIIDFSKATEAQLEALASACQPASFGLKPENVLDESYRKAGKLDSTDFATQLSLSSTGIYGAIVSNFLRGNHSASSVHAELYKLDVYVSSAFYSDIEHEVLPVTSGYRVTLTYNLYLLPGREVSESVRVGVNPNLAQMKTSLAEIPADPLFLPKGGFLGFGLRYRYPFSQHSTRLSEFGERLKGSDMVIKEICEALSLEVSLKALYNLDDQPYFFLLSNFVDFGPSEVEENRYSFFRDETRGVLAYGTNWMVLE